MAYFVADEKLQGYYVSDGVTINIVKYHFECDDAASLPAQGAFITSKKVKISMSSTAHTIDTDTLYKMDSSGAWVQQSQPWQPLADYSVLSNKPQINWHTLTGNQSGADLGLQNTLTFDNTPAQDSTNPVTSGGIWTDQQRQEAEIGAVANAGAKNFAPIETGTNTTGNKWIVGAGSGNAEQINLIAGDYIFTAVSSSTGSGQCQIKLTYSDGTTALTTTFSFGSTMTLTFTATKDVVGYGVYSNAAPVIFEKMMIRPAAITDPTFQPYAKTNRELTVLTDEDRAALVELVDGGDKNKFTKDSDTVSSSGSWSTTSGLTNIKAGKKYIMSFENLTSNDTDSTTIQIRFSNPGTSYKFYRQCQRGQNVFVSFTPEQDITEVRIYKADSYDNGTGDEMSYSGAMICTEAAWKISQTFQQYRPSWQEMYDMILAGISQ